MWIADFSPSLPHFQSRGPIKFSSISWKSYRVNYPLIIRGAQKTPNSWLGGNHQYETLALHPDAGFRLIA